MEEHQNLDNLIQWQDFYQQYIRTPITTAGIDKMHACCPFHQEREPSFWFNTKNGMWKCEAGCGQGNATTFLSKIEQISTGEAYKKLCDFAGVSAQDNRKSSVYTLKEYAFEKRLPVEFLQSLGVKDGYANRFVAIPYKDESGAVVATRKRMPHGSAQRFLWTKGAKPTLYGRWRMEEIRAAQYVVLAEGESDTQTLWHMGISALGFPGATNFNVQSAKLILDVPLIYLHVEPDKGGQIAKRKVAQALLDAGYTGVVKPWSCAAHGGLKDPSAVWCAEGEKAADILWEIMKAAQPMNLDSAVLATVAGLDEAPLQLRVPAGYDMTADGIYKIDAKTGVLSDEPFCWTPILITRILTDEIGEAKVELAFKRAGQWKTIRAMRNVLASSRTIVQLANYELNVHSENGGDVVRFLAAQEQANFDLIPHLRRASHYGWLEDKHFVPFDCEGVELDADGYAGFARVGNKAGDLNAWVEAMRPHRKRGLFRFILASSFAAPLLKILGQRIFMVYNWGDSKGGKTAAMFAALSAWGDPEDLRVSFNSTKVALERTIGFFSDLPVGLNERQLAGSKQEFVENLVYMLAEGKGKGRGTREGGLQRQSTWRSIIIANGEESLSGESTQTGVVTRALEIYGRPFGTDEESASRMYATVAAHHGHAGQAFIKTLLKFDFDRLRELYQGILQKLIDLMGSGVRGHAPSIAVVCVADFLISCWLFQEETNEALASALGMASDIFCSMDVAEAGDVNQKAYEYLLDWLMSHRKQFTDDFTGMTRYGMLEGGGKYMLAYPSIVDQALRERGFAPKKVRRWLAENEKIDMSEQADGRLLDTVQRRIAEKRVRYIRFLMPTDNEQEGFVPVTDENLPFKD